jgi:hypothetical protein
MLLQTARVLVLMAYILVLRRTTNSQNYLPLQLKQTLQLASRTLSIMSSHYWIAIPDLLQSISIAMLHIGAAEFLSAQVPQFMKEMNAHECRTLTAA